MSIFDKGFDPLQEIQRATKTAGETATKIAEVASGMAVAASAAVVDTAATAGAAIAGVASGAKAVLDEKEAERLDAEKAEYTPKVQEALRAIEATRRTGATRLIPGVSAPVDGSQCRQGEVSLPDTEGTRPSSGPTPSSTSGPAASP